MPISVTILILILWQNWILMNGRGRCIHSMQTITTLSGKGSAVSVVRDIWLGPTQWWRRQWEPRLYLVWPDPSEAEDDWKFCVLMVWLDNWRRKKSFECMVITLKTRDKLGNKTLHQEPRKIPECQIGNFQWWTTKASSCFFYSY